MKKFAQRFNQVEEAISVLIFAVLVLDVFIGVIWRYVLNNSLVWSDELSRLLFAWLTWFGLSVGEAHKEHIKITMLTDRLPFRVAHAVNILANLITIAIAAIVAYYVIVVSNTMAGSMYVTLKVPYAVGYWSIPVGCALYIIRLLFDCSKSLKYAVKGESALSLDDIVVPSELAGVMSKEDYLEMLKNQKGGKEN